MMSGNHSDSARPRRRRQNLEFDFAGWVPSTARKGRRATPRAPREPAAEGSGESAARTISAAAAAAAAARPSILHAPRPVVAGASASESSFSSPGSESSGPSHQPQKEPAMATTHPHPTPISASRSIDRQVREQRAISALLQGAGLALISAILVVAGLAALGGYVLYKQLQDQSATLALLEQNTKQRMFEMEMDLTRRDTELAKNLEQSNLRLTALTSQFEEHRYQTTQTLAELRARNRELERQLSLYQKKVNDQQSIIARLR